MDFKTTMKSRFFHKLLIVVLVFINFEGFTQILFHQESLKGGFCGDGRSYLGMTYLSTDTIVFKNFIPSGSSLHKAFLFYRRLRYPSINNQKFDSPFIIQFNGAPLILDSANIVSNQSFHCDNSNTSGENWMCAVDVTSLTIPINNTLVRPQFNSYADPNYPNFGFFITGFYLLIIYENNSFNTANVAVTLNNKTHPNQFNPLIESLNSLNNFNTNYNFGLSIWNDNTHSNSSTQTTPSYTLNSSSGNFYVGQLLSDSPYGGYREDSLPGSFNYYNNTLYGLVDDTPDAFIDSTDALANIAGYLPQGASTFTLSSLSASNPGCVNLRFANFLSYTSTCPPYGGIDQSSDTAICKYQTVSLNAFPCNNCTYSWYPAEGLSDSTISNPIASPASSINYICTITDSVGCHFTEHHRIVVHQVFKPDTFNTTSALCGGNGGTLIIDNAYYNYQPYTYTIAGIQSSDSIISNIAAGTYTLNISDNLGCVYQQNISINEYSNVNANFTPVPSSGVYPLNVNFYNGSTNTNYYIWYNGSDTVLTQNYQYTFQQPGTYTVALISYFNLPHCADTTYAVITVEDSLQWYMPNVFTPNSDKLNDLFFITPHYYENIEWQIFDRWGLLMKQGNERIKTTNNSYIELWDGKSNGNEAPVGTYYYIIQLKHPNKENKTLKGYVSLMR